MPLPSLRRGIEWRSLTMRSNDHWCSLCFERHSCEEMKDHFPVGGNKTYQCRTSFAEQSPPIIMKRIKQRTVDYCLFKTRSASPSVIWQTSLLWSEISNKNFESLQEKTYDVREKSDFFSFPNNDTAGVHLLRCRHCWKWTQLWTLTLVEIDNCLNFSSCW